MSETAGGMAISRVVRPAPVGVAATADQQVRRVFESDYGRLVNAAHALVGDRDDAEEIVQEAFARSHSAWNRKGIPPEPAAYVRVAVVNLSRNRIRRKLLGLTRRAERAERLEDPEQMALDRVEQSCLSAAVSSLPRRQRECVALRYLLDATVLETADVLEISEGSVKTHTHRALRALETMLEVDDQ